MLRSSSQDPTSPFLVPRMFSDYNSELNQNIRSYFDRLRDAPDPSGQTYVPMFLKPTWRLDQPAPTATPAAIPSCVNRSVSLWPAKKARPRSVSQRPPWNSQHHLLFGRANLAFHRNFREYFDVKKPPAM
jgi:hypothetical protein